MKKIVLLIIGIILANIFAYSQSNLDSVISKYLVEARQIGKSINTTTQVKEGKFLKKTNYFFDKKPIIRVSDSITLQPVIFGCYKSHAGKYLLIQFKINSNSIFYFYGDSKLLYDLEKLRNEILEKVKPSINDEEVAALVNYLSLCYL